jgi:Histidine kinase
MTRLLGWARETAREWGWLHTAWGVVVGSVAVFNMGEAAVGIGSFDLGIAWLFNVLQFGMPYVFALRVADRAVAAGVSRGLAYAGVVLLVLPAGVWVFGPLLSPVLGGVPDLPLRFDFGLALTRLLPFTVGTLAYAHWRRERDTLLRLRGAEVERARQQQRVQSARLLALQARVEPQFLFDTLRRVRDQIGSADAAAERLLGDLIALLRAMQPAAGATASSVAREFALIEAYARANETPALQPPRLTLLAEPEAQPAALAPLVLLPAVRALVGNAPDASWRLVAERRGARLTITLGATAPDAAALVALDTLDSAALAERLKAVHGPDAAQRTDLAAHTLLIDLPYRDDDDDPSPDR